MKNIILVLALIFILNDCTAQSVNTKLDGKMPDLLLFVITLDNGKEVATPDLIIRSFEVDSLVEIKRSVYLKKPYKKNYRENTAAFRLLPKPNVRFIDLKQILGTFKINEKHKQLPVKINGKATRGDYRNIYATADAIQSVKIDPDGKSITITIKPEDQKRK